jgi:hypothetical protein
MSVAPHDARARRRQRAADRTVELGAEAFADSDLPLDRSIVDPRTIAIGLVEQKIEDVITGITNEVVVIEPGRTVADAEERSSRSRPAAESELSPPSRGQRSASVIVVCRGNELRQAAIPEKRRATTGRTSRPDLGAVDNDAVLELAMRLPPLSAGGSVRGHRHGRQIGRLRHHPF